MGGVSLVSLQSLTSAQPQPHPWMAEAGSWLSSGFCVAADLATGSDLESVSRLLDLCKKGIVGDLERQRVFGRLGKVLIDVIDAWDGSQGQKSDIDEVNKDVWNAQKCGAVDLKVEVLSRLLNFTENLFVSECESLIICSLEADDSKFANDPLLKVVPHDVDLFQKLLRIFSTLFDSIEINAKLVKTFRNLCHFVLEQSENPILLFPVKHRSLVCLLYNKGVATIDIYPDPSVDPDVHLLSLLFDAQ